MSSDPATHSAGCDLINDYFAGLGDRLISGNFPSKIDAAFGEQTVTYVGEDDGIYAVLDFKLPSGAYAEIDGKTYGTMHALRILLADANDEAEIAEGTYALQLTGDGDIDVIDEDGNRINSVNAGEQDYSEYLTAIVQANLV